MLCIIASDIALWAVPFGAIGGRPRHVTTDPELYFVCGENPWNAFAVWHGGLSIWGAILLGALGTWIRAPLGPPRNSPP